MFDGFWRFIKGFWFDLSSKTSVKIKGFAFGKWYANDGCSTSTLVDRMVYVHPSNFGWIQRKVFDNSNRLPLIHYLLKTTLYPEIPSLVENLLSTDCQKAHGFYCEYWSSKLLTYCGWASEIAKSPVDRWFIHVYPIIHRFLTIQNWCNKNRWPMHIIHPIGPRSAGVLYVCWPLLQWRPVSQLSVKMGKTPMKNVHVYCRIML